MAEIEQEVKTFKINYLCDACGKGDVKSDGNILLSDPPIYPHKCAVCGSEYNFAHRYPLIVTRRIP